MGVVDEVEACVRLEYERLVRVVAVATGSVPAAQDAVRAALVRALERASRGGEFTHLAGWVVTVALSLPIWGEHQLGSRVRTRPPRTRSSALVIAPDTFAFDPTTSS
jgi:DNA-directed RNA polymerase specialized sigma24 family protein